MTAVAPLLQRPPQQACAACGAACIHCAARTIAEATAYPLRVVEPEPLPDFLRVEEVAQRLSVSDDTVSRLIADGDLQAIRIRSRIRVPAEAYRAYVESLS